MSKSIYATNREGGLSFPFSLIPTNVGHNNGNSSGMSAVNKNIANLKTNIFSLSGHWNCDQNHN